MYLTIPGTTLDILEKMAASVVLIIWRRLGARVAELGHQGFASALITVEIRVSQSTRWKSHYLN